MEQFVKLQQGDQSIIECLRQFNHLSQYAPDYVSTDADKKFWFERGLDLELQVVLVGQTKASYNECQYGHFC